MNDQELREVIQSSLLISVPITGWLLPKELKKKFPDHWLVMYSSQNKLKYTLLACCFIITARIFVDGIVWLRRKSIEKEVQQIVNEQ